MSAGSRATDMSLTTGLLAGLPALVTWPGDHRAMIYEE